MPRAARPTADLVDAPTDHRRRLLDAMAHTVADKGYPETTIADLAAAARVSRRTFYEHFDDKAACLIALYEAAAAQALAVLRDALDPAHAWEQQVETALAAYFSTLACNPKLLRTLFIEILALGPPGLAARRRTNLHLADLIREVVDRPAPASSRAAPLPADAAMGIVGALNELVLQAIEEDRAADLAALTPAAARLSRAVIAAY